MFIPFIEKNPCNIVAKHVNQFIFIFKGTSINIMLSVNS